MLMNTNEIIPAVRQDNIIPFPLGRRARRCTFSGERAQESMFPTAPLLSPAPVLEPSFCGGAETGQVHPVVRLRKKLGIRQQALADLVGLGVTTIKRVEAGERVSLYTVAALSEFFSERYKRSLTFGEVVPITQWQGYDG